MSTPAAGTVSMPGLPILVIHLPRATQRRERLAGRLDQLGLADHATWLAAVDGLSLDDEDMGRHCSTEGFRRYRKNPQLAAAGSLTRGALACALSWKSALGRVAAPTLVLEDDAVLPDDFVDRFRTAWRDVPPDWDLVYLSCNPHGTRHVGTALTPCVLRVERRLHGTGAIVVRPDAVPALLSLFPLTLQLDHDLPDRLIMTGRLKAYLATFQGEPLVTNDNLDGSYTQFGNSPAW